MPPILTVLLFLLFLLFLHIPAMGADAGAYVEPPNLVGAITKALEASKLDHLTPHTYRQADQAFSYHLKSVSYLGRIERGTESCLLATALFIRSSAKGSEYPPPRAHGYLLCLSPDFQLISHCKLDFPDVALVGTMLRRGGVAIADLKAADDATRRHGFLIDGDSFLPYPFANRLPASPSVESKKP